MLKKIVAGVVLGLLLIVAIMGCSPKVECVECVSMQDSIAKAESFMRDNSMRLVYPGDWTPEFKVEYTKHHKWINVRDAISSAKGEDK